MLNSRVVMKFWSFRHGSKIMVPKLKTNGAAMTIYSVRRSVYLSATFTAAFLFLSVWATELFGIELGVIVLNEPISLKGQQWSGLSLGSMVVALKIVCFIVFGYVVGTWFFAIVAQSKWAVAFFMAALSLVDLDFAFIFIPSLGALYFLYLWMEGLPPFEIRQRCASQYFHYDDFGDQDYLPDHERMQSNDINPATGMKITYGTLDSGGEVSGVWRD